MLVGLVTKKLPAETADPFAVVTAIFPLAKPLGTTAVTCVASTGVADATTVPNLMEIGVLLRFAPTTVTVAPGSSPPGLKDAIEGSALNEPVVVIGAA